MRQQLASQADAADVAAKGMIAKTSEVAAASEQSAMAMREAASTAAGLIRAIEDARSEVEASASVRSDEHTSELQSLMRISYAVFGLKKKYTTLPAYHTYRDLVFLRLNKQH